jgi:hypothetical protein
MPFDTISAIMRTATNGHESLLYLMSCLSSGPKTSLAPCSACSLPGSLDAAGEYFSLSIEAAMFESPSTIAKFAMLIVGCCSDESLRIVLLHDDAAINGCERNGGMINHVPNMIASSRINANTVSGRCQH